MSLAKRLIKELRAKKSAAEGEKQEVQKALDLKIQRAKQMNLQCLATMLEIVPTGENLDLGDGYELTLISVSEAGAHELVRCAVKKDGKAADVTYYSERSSLQADIQRTSARATLRLLLARAIEEIQ